MSELAQRTCGPCRGDVPPFTETEARQWRKKLSEGWKVIENHHLEKTFVFKNFREALAFTNQVGKISEEENHHPDIYLAWGQVKITLWTHKINGLAENDFILAAKIDQAVS